VFQINAHVMNREKRKARASQAMEMKHLLPNGNHREQIRQNSPGPPAFPRFSFLSGAPWETAAIWVPSAESSRFIMGQIRLFGFSASAGNIRHMAQLRTHVRALPFPMHFPIHRRRGGPSMIVTENGQTARERERDQGNRVFSLELARGISAAS